MSFYTVTDLIKLLNYSRSKVYQELEKWNATLQNDFKVQYTYPGRIRKDLFEMLTGPVLVEEKKEKKEEKI